MPEDVKPRVLSTAIHPENASASLDLALEAAPYFQLDAARARATVAEIAQKTAAWRQAAKSCGLTDTEAGRMASAFEHDDLELGLRLQG